jgi:hypothetical protein
LFATKRAVVNLELFPDIDGLSVILGIGWDAQCVSLNMNTEVGIRELRYDEPFYCPATSAMMLPAFGFRGVLDELLFDFSFAILTHDSIS